MLRIMMLMSVFVVFTGCLAGCEQKSATSEKPSAAASESGHEGHDHAAMDADDADEEHDEHAGHDHGDDVHAGEALELGAQTAGAFKVRVEQFGKATDDAAELVFEIDVEGEAVPDAVRVLVRNADGDESLKVKANKVGEDAYDVHVGELPSQLGQGGTLVVELEAASSTVSAEFKLSH